MKRALLGCTLLSVLASCSNTGPGAGAVRAVLEWKDFAPGCVALTARDAQDAARSERSTLALADGARQGQKVIAVFRGADWSNQVTLVAEAFEGGCEDGVVVARAEQQVEIATGVVTASFTLSAKDADGDGFVDAQADLPGTDCNDAVAAVSPAALEICNDVDDDCDGAVDEDAGDTWYQDADGDGFGDPLYPQRACAQPSGFVANADDCDDGRTGVNPDGTETCNGLDDNCDGQVDEGHTQGTWYADADGDGDGDPATSVQACAAPPGYVATNTDCNPGDPSIYKGAPETCNGIDDNCNGVIDEGVKLTFYRDADGDTWGLTDETVEACEPPAGYATRGGDCDDGDPNNFQGNAEVCDGRDNDCDGDADDGLNQDFFADADGDGFGDPGDKVFACMAPAGYVDNDDDCDDALGSVYPGAAEVCNQIDDNCDGQIDEGVLVTWYLDQDGDGYGDPAHTLMGCPPAPTGYAANGDDCNDAVATIHPGAMEVCNAVDDNCDTQIDEGLPTQPWPLDADGDGHGHLTQTVVACGPGNGAAAMADDCDDGNPFDWMGGPEVCDGIDNNCDGQADEGGVCTTHSWKTPTNTGGGAHDWRRIAVVDPQTIWAVGNDKLRKVNGQATAINADGNCNGTWYNAWFDSGTNRVYLSGLSGTGGALTSRDNDASGNVCGSPISTGEAPEVRGLWGWTGAGGLDLYAVDSGGHFFRWETWQATPTVVLLGQVPGTWFDLDGSSPRNLIAVGSVTAGGNVIPAVARSTASGTFQLETLPSGLPAGAELRTVSVSPLNGFAVAVGDKGVILTRENAPGAAWITVSPPPNAADLTGAWAAGPSLFYVAGTTASGFGVWRREDGTWTELTGIALNKTPRDLGGTSPADLWVVGDDGLIRTWAP